MLSRGAHQPPLTLLPTLPASSALHHCMQTGMYHEKRYIFVSDCSGIAPLSTWDCLADVLLSSPGPCTLAELLQVGEGHGRIDLPRNITCFYSNSWYVIVTLEREETAFFSEKRVEKSICIKTGIFCYIQPGTAEVPYHWLVLGKRPAQKSTDPFLQAPTLLPGLPRGPAPHCRMQSCSGRIRPSSTAKPGLSPEGSDQDPVHLGEIFPAVFLPKSHPTKQSGSSNPSSFAGDEQQNRQMRLILSPPVAEEVNLLPGEFYQLVFQWL